MNKMSEIEHNLLVNEVEGSWKYIIINKNK